MSVYLCPGIDRNSTYHHTTDHLLRKQRFQFIKTVPSSGNLTKQNRVITLVTKGCASGEGHVGIVGIQTSQFSAVSVQPKGRAAEMG